MFYLPWCAACVLCMCVGVVCPCVSCAREDLTRDVDVVGGAL